MRILRAAVVGTGHLGRHHARNLARVDGVSLVAVVDPDEARGRAVADACGCAWAPDLSSLDTSLDLVSIAAPTPLHFEIATHFVSRGIHCLIEKPMCASAGEARELARRIEQSDAIVQVGHIERFNPVMRHVSAGGEPRFADFRRLAPYPNRSTETSVVFDLMIHDLDLALWLFGAEVREVSARGGSLRGPMLDYAAARIEFGGGGAAHVYASRVASEPVRRVTIHEPARSLEIDFADRSVRVVGADLRVQDLRAGDDEPLFLELRAFVECVRRGVRPACSEREGLAAVELAERVEDAIRSSGR